MIDTLALAVVLTSSSGGVCKHFTAPDTGAATPIVSFRGIGPKRLAVSVSDRLLSQGLGGAVLSSRIQMSLRSPRSIGLGTLSQSRAVLTKFESALLNRPMERPVAALVTESSQPPLFSSVLGALSVGQLLPIVSASEARHVHEFSAPQTVIVAPGGVEPTAPNVQIPGQKNAATNKFYEPQPVAPMEKRVSVSLSATPLETVVGLLSKQTGINIVLISKSDQKVTLNIKEMPLSEAMKHISALAGMRTLKVRNTLVMADDAILKVAYPEEYASETPEKVSSSASTSNPTIPVVAPATKSDDVFKVVALKHLGAATLVNALRDAVSKLGVSIVAMPNSLVPRLNVVAAAGAAPLPGADQAVDNSRTILISGPAAGVAQLEAIINSTDIARRQVQITVTIHDVSDSALNEQGIQWVPGQFNVSEITNSSPNLGTFQRSGVSFSATLKALEQKDKARLLSSPNLNVMDGESSSILIGEKRQFPIVASFNANGQPVFSVQELKIGIQLDVSAQITSDGSITLAVRPEVSSIIEFLNVNGGTYPQITTRSSENRLTMRDGDTMVIGGLVKEEDIKNYQRLPLLSNIPFFGELFKSRRIEKRKSQLIISITPNIIKQ
jgi:type II secretory pathway component GspD/PulD (secretin)